MQVSCAGLQCTPQLWTSCMGSMQRQAGPVLPARLQSLQVKQATKAAACRGSFNAILQHERLCQLHCRPVMRAGCIRAIPAAWGALPLLTLICTGRHHHHCSCSLHWSRTQKGSPNGQEMGLETSPPHTPQDRRAAYPAVPQPQDASLGTFVLPNWCKKCSSTLKVCSAFMPLQAMFRWLSMTAAN